MLRAAPAGEAPLLVHLDGAPGRGGDALWIEHEGGTDLEASFLEAMAADAPGLRSEVRLRRAGRTSVAAATVSGVRPYALTLAANQACWKLVGTVVRTLERLDAAPELAAAATPEDPQQIAAARRVPLGLPIRWARALATRGLARRPWRLRVRALGEPGAPWGKGSVVAERPGHLYADPFLIERDGAAHLFCEEVPLGAHRGVISHVELGVPGAFPEPVLTAEHHLSYPFVLEHEGEVLMVPESASARRVELWRATAFPTEWVLDTVLLDDAALADATPFEHDGRWWLFGTVAEPGASLLDELHLFMAPELRGPWTPHPANPVVSDVRCARPAGPVLRTPGGGLVRPAQDGSRRYGGSLVLQEILTLTPDAYAERTLDRLDAADVPGARAVHHYCRGAGYEAIDVRVREPRLARRPPGRDG